MNITKLYQDYNIPMAPEGHKHLTPGWVNVECPFCSGNPGYHLGYSIPGDYFKCWRCGWHDRVKVLSTLLNINRNEVFKVIKTYNGKTVEKRLQAISQRNNEFKFPTNTNPLEKQHIKYLKNRDYDPAFLSDFWNIKGTGPVSNLDGRDYKPVSYTHLTLPTKRIV